MSPRIAWFGFLRLAGRFAKFACVLAILTGIGWGIWRGVQNAFHDNPDFRLQVIDLNPNPVIDEPGVAEVAQIDLTASIFDVDVNDVTEKLKAIPSIADASTETHMPSKLVVRVVARKPMAWILCPEAGLTETRREGAMLVDQNRVAYPCPPLQLESALLLPEIRLPHSEGEIQPGKTLDHKELTQCIRLLKSATKADDRAPQWIDSIEQVNSWSVRLVTRDGTEATFGIGDHDNQINRLRAALDHASHKGYAIRTINLIPKYNVPITVGNESIPRAELVPEPTPGDIRNERRARDLNTLLHGN